MIDKKGAYSFGEKPAPNYHVQDSILFYSETLFWIIFGRYTFSVDLHSFERFNLSKDPQKASTQSAIHLCALLIRCYNFSLTALKCNCGWSKLFEIFVFFLRRRMPVTTQPKAKGSDLAPFKGECSPDPSERIYDLGDHVKVNTVFLSSLKKNGDILRERSKQ